MEVELRLEMEVPGGLRGSVVEESEEGGELVGEAGGVQERHFERRDFMCERCWTLKICSLFRGVVCCSLEFNDN